MPAVPGQPKLPEVHPGGGEGAPPRHQAPHAEAGVWGDEAHQQEASDTSENERNKVKEEDKDEEE